MSAPRPVAERRAEADRFDLRRVHPRLRFGTASDRYAGWIGDIYPRDVWAGEVTTRKKRVGRESFEERLLPVASVADYFEHFGVLELDFPYYRPFIEPTGKPGANLFALQRYAEHAPANARFVVKAPRDFVAMRTRTKRDGRTAYVDNPQYLDAAAFEARYLRPLRDALGVRLAGVILEQEYVRRGDAPHPEAFAAGWHGFFRELPNDVAYHLEVRSDHLAGPALTAVLEEHGVGRVFSHWTWLPPIVDQWRRSGEAFSSRHGEAVVRLLNPIDMPYERAFALAYPFTAAVEGLAGLPQIRRMVDEATALAFQAAEAGVTLNVIANNRAWGSAPDLARTVANRFLDFAERRGQ